MARTRISEARLAGLAFVVAFVLSGLWSTFVGPIDGVPLLPCPLRLTTGVPCPGCGMTRACLALARGDLRAAWALHPLAFLLVPLAFGLALVPRKLARLWSQAPVNLKRVGVAAGLALCLGLWSHAVFCDMA